MKNLVDSFNKETKTHTAHCDSFGIVCSCGHRCPTYKIWIAHKREEEKE